MNPIAWIRDLPGHMAEALGLLRRHGNLAGLRVVALALMLILTIAATSIGLMDLISATEAGDIKPAERVIVMALAGAAVVSMWLALEFAIAARRPLARVVCAAVYAFLVLWSIGFGFGFYWKHIASVSQAQDDMTKMIGEVQQPLQLAASRLATVRAQINQVSSASRERSQIEATRGGACGIPSPPGEGPLWQARNEISSRVEALTARMDSWLGGGVVSAQPASPAATQPAGAVPSAAPPAATQPDSLEGDLQALVDESNAVREEFREGGSDPEAMRERFLQVGQEAKAAITRVNGIIQDKAEYADELDSFAKDLSAGLPVNGVVCRDEPLAYALAAAARQLRGLQPIDEEKAALDPQLGAKATQHAFYRLWNNAAGLLPWVKVPDENRLTSKDFVALIAAIVVDIVIAFLTLFGRAPNQLDPIAEVLLLRLGDPQMRRRLTEVVRIGGPRLRASFDHSVAVFRGRHFLIATPDLPEVQASVANLQIVLMAAREGRSIPPRGPCLQAILPRDRAEMLETFQRRLQQSWSEITEQPLRRRPASDFAASRMTVLRLKPQTVLALQLLFSGVTPAPSGAAREAARPDAEPAAAARPRAQRRPGAGPGPRAAGQAGARPRRPRRPPGDEEPDPSAGN